MSLNKTKIFFEKFQTKQESLASFRIDFDKTKYKYFFRGFTSVNNVIELIEQKETPNFNIFEILNIQFKETGTHTPFLVDLLSINGKHSQKDLFLRRFIHRFISNEYYSNFDNNDVFVYEEKSTKEGRIDIFIQNINPQNKFAIIIENKIHAGDQEKQLERYYNYAKNNLKLEDNQIRILYLSPNGSNPSTNEKVGSVSLELLNLLKENKVLKCISYNEDIYKWLKESKEEVESIKLKQTLVQYLQTIKNI